MGYVGDLSNQEILEHFGVFLSRLSHLLTSMIGADATAAVLWSALQSARRDYPVLHGLQVSESGGHVEPLQANLNNVGTTELRNSLTAYINGVIDLITDIAGEVLVLKMTPLVQQFQQRLED